MSPSIIKQKSYAFALKAVKICVDLDAQRHFVLSRQLLRSATSIGANVEEASQAESKADFIHKMSIALKESFETHYWLRLLNDSYIIDHATATILLDDCLEIQRILTSIIKTSKAS